MENASKALIIAGAILISILLIGLGVGVYQMASGTVKSANLGSQEAQAQNSQFEDLFGDRKTSADVKNIMTLVRNNNITGNTNAEQKEIHILYNGVETAPSKVAQAVKAGKTYWVNVENDNAYDEKTKEEKVTTSSAAYYNTGYLRVISIYEGEHKATE